jgi:hypothetical protein
MMTDARAHLEALERLAAEAELISWLAPDQRARTHNASLARRLRALASRLRSGDDASVDAPVWQLTHQ